MIALLVIVYLICAVLIAGMFFAYFTGKWPEHAESREELGYAIFIGLLGALSGPIGVLVVFLISGFAEYGWKLWIKDKP